MPAISRLFDFQAGTTIQSSQVDDEFNQLISTINALPDKNGVLQTNLNADLLDGFHANNAGGTNNIPVCVLGTIQTNLNADLLDGLHASDISAAAFAVGTKMLFYQASVPGGWDLVVAPTDHVLSWKSGAVGGTNTANNWIISGISIAAHTLTEAEMPLHFHDLNNHTHDLASHTHGPGTFVANRFFADLTGPTGSSPSMLRASLTTFGGDNPRVITGVSDPPSVNTSGTPSNNTSGNKGGGGPHAHNLTSGGTWRPPQSYIIIGSKA